MGRNRNCFQGRNTRSDNLVDKERQRQGNTQAKEPAGTDTRARFNGVPPNIPQSWLLPRGGAVLTACPGSGSFPGTPYSSRAPSQQPRHQNETPRSTRTPGSCRQPAAAGALPRGARKPGGGAGGARRQGGTAPARRPALLGAERGARARRRRGAAGAGGGGGWGARYPPP